MTFQSDFRIDFQTFALSEDRLILGSALVQSDSTALTRDAVIHFHKENKRHVLAVFADAIPADVQRYCREHRIMLIELSGIQKELARAFAIEVPTFTKSKIGGMIAPVNPKYRTSILNKAGAWTFFKGGPTGKYLRPGNKLAFLFEDTEKSHGGGIVGYADILNIETGPPANVWAKCKSGDPVFPEDDFLTWSVDKAEVIGVTCGPTRSLVPLSAVKALDLLGLTLLDVDRLGQMYLSEDHMNTIVTRPGVTTHGPADMSQTLIVFLSSTIDDLADERLAVVECVRDRLRYNVFASEMAGARTAARAEILEVLQRSAIYVCVVGSRYGSIVNVEGRQLSATHDEFLNAKRLGKPILVYVKQNVPREAALERFLTTDVGEYLKGQKYQHFNTSTQLQEHLTADIARVLSRGSHS